jgi:hypothetical protein
MIYQASRLTTLLIGYIGSPARVAVVVLEIQVTLKFLDQDFGQGLQVSQVLGRTYRFLRSKVGLELRDSAYLADLCFIDSLDAAYEYQGGR